MDKLATYVEDISDDFHSTFCVVNDNTLSNLLSKDDFENLTKIIKNYIPNVKVKYTKTNQLNNDYDIYIIEAS